MAIACCVLLLGASPAVEKEPLRVLFVGNSFTFYNGEEARMPEPRSVGLTPRVARFLEAVARDAVPSPRSGAR